MTLISCWQHWPNGWSGSGTAVPWLGLKFNDASCRLCQPGGTNDLALPAQRHLDARHAAARTRRWGCHEPMVGPCAAEGLELSLKSNPPISIFHYTQLSDRAPARCSILSYLNFDLLFPASVCEEEEKDGGVSINKNSTDANLVGRMLVWIIVPFVHTVS